MMIETTVDRVAESALQLLYCRYEQVIEVNLSDQYCKVLWSKDDAKQFCIDSLWNSTKLHSNDFKTLRKFHNIEYIRNKLAFNSSICTKFRLKEGKHFHWMQVEVIPNECYNDDNVDILLFVKDIEDSFGQEYRARKIAEKLSQTDPLTGYANRLAFKKFCDSFNGTSFGIVYIDLNCLKEVNDTRGHDAGDTYIKECCAKINKAFGSYNRYRIGGDEFVVFASTGTSEEFYSSVNTFMSVIEGSMLRMPECSMGYIWTEDSKSSVTKLVRDAERMMYVRKEADYLRYNKDRRRH